MDPTPGRVLIIAFVAASCLWSCTCGQAPVVQSGDLQAALDVDAGLLEVRHADRIVAAIDARSVGVKEGFASYTMEFGMFDIVEDLRPFRFGAGFRVGTVDDSSIAFDVTDADDEILATGRVTVADGIARLTVDAIGTDNRVVVSTPCASDEHFIGLGAQSADVDHRGQTVPLWVSEQGVGKSDTNDLPVIWQLLGRRHTTHVPMPAFLRSDGTGVVLDVEAFSRIDFCAADPERVTFEVWQQQLALDLLPQDDVLAAQQALSERLGRPRLLPPYAFAPWNDAIFSEQQVRDFAAFLREREIPSSVIWSEDWRGGSDAGQLYRLDEDWRLDREVYPDYEGMAAELRTAGIAHQVYFNTFLTETGDVFNEVTAAGFDIRRADDGSTHLFTGVDKNFSPTALLDLTNADAVTYVKEHLKDVEVVALHKMVRETLVFLTHLDHQQTEEIMIEKLGLQVHPTPGGPGWSRQGLSTLCWAIGYCQKMY